MKLGIRAHDLECNTIENVLAKANQSELNYLQLVFKKAFKEDNKTILFSKENAIRVSNLLDKYNIKVAMLGAYFNPVHKDKEKVRNEVSYFKEHLKYASILKTNYVGTETGSYNNDSWTYNVKNQTEEGYQETKKVFEELTIEAEKYNTTLLIEPSWNHVIFDVKTLKRLIDELDSPNVAVTIDIYNLLSEFNYKDYKNIFKEALETFKDKVKIIHLKDFKVILGKIVQVSPGKGLIDYNYLLETVNKYCPDATLIFEGVTGKDILTSKELIEKTYAKITK